MRPLPLVLAVVLVNDAILLLALDVAVPTWLVVAGASLALTTPVLVAVSVGVGGGRRPSNAELRDEVAALRERVAALEAAAGRENN